MQATQSAGRATLPDLAAAGEHRGERDDVVDNHVPLRDELPRLDPVEARR